MSTKEGLWSEEANRDQRKYPKYLEDRVLFALTGPHKLCASCSRTCLLLPATWLEIGDQWLLLCSELKLMKINHNLPLSFPESCKPLIHSRVLKKTLSGRFCPCSCLCGETQFSMLPTLPTSQNPILYWDWYLTVQTPLCFRNKINMDGAYYPFKYIS